VYADGMMSLNEFKAWFDERFLAVIEEKIKEFLGYSSAVVMTTALSRITNFVQEGKRLRPYMAYLGYVTEGGEHTAFELFAAIELLHLFCLVHDDSMDNAATRHASQTFHTMFDVPTAILLGDMFLAWSFECLQAVEDTEPYTIDDCRKEYITMLKEVVHGQMLEMLSSKNNSTKESIENTIRLKSAHYSFYRPLALGMLLAGADNEAIDFAKAFGVNLGTAFQLQDDVQDWQEDEKNNQRTMATWYRQAYPDDMKHYIGNSIAEYLESAQDAIYAYNKDSEEIWEETIETVKRL